MKTLTQKEIKKLAEKKAGTVKSWLTPQERQTYINGVIDGLTICFQKKK